MIMTQTKAEELNLKTTEGEIVLEAYDVIHESALGNPDEYQKAYLKLAAKYKLELFRLQSELRGKEESWQQAFDIKVEQLTLLHKQLEDLKTKQETWQQTWNGAVATNQELHQQLEAYREAVEKIRFGIETILKAYTGTPFPELIRKLEALHSLTSPPKEGK